MPDSDRWKLVKVANSVGEVVERSKAIISLIVAAGGIGSFVTYYYALYIQYQIYVLSLLVLFVLLTSVAATWIISNERFRTQDAIVAAEFLRLESIYLPFEREAVRLLYQVAQNSTGSIDVRSLETLHADYLEALCNTAVSVFEAKKPRRTPITANIKRIEVSTKSGATRFVYGPLVRSLKYDQKRLEYDQGLEEDPLEVQSNYVYRRIFDPHYQDDFYLHDDIKKLLKEIELSKETATEPNEQSTQFYRSFIVFPILGLVESDPPTAPAILDNYMQYKKKNVFGLMCVDSCKRKAFNLGADADILRQLTSYAFGAFRLVQAIYDLARRKGLSVDTRRMR